MCCGRPLYDFGMLDTAKELLRDILTTLQPQIEAGVPIVGLEPSCVAVFRDELLGLFPHDENAQRLSKQTFLLSEFLNKHAGDFQPPPLPRKALVHGHCHQKALIGMKDEEAILKKLGLDFEVPESGCCGMAGSFGFEAGEHYRLRRAGVIARGPPGGARHTDHCRRLQLSGADRPDHGPAGAAPR